MRAIESIEPHRSPQNRSGSCRTSRRGQLAPPPAPRSSAAPDAKHEAPIAAWQPLRRGAPPHASRRWRRGGRTLHSTASERCTPQKPTAPHRGTRATLGVLKRGDGVDASSGVRRGAPRRGDRSRAPFSTFHQCSAKRPRLARKQLRIQKETTHGHHSWKRVISMK